MSQRNAVWVHQFADYDLPVERRRLGNPRAQLGRVLGADNRFLQHEVELNFGVGRVQAVVP